MKLVGCVPVRNEAWCLGLSLRVALMWCDEVVVLLHACTDASTEIALRVAAEYRNRVWIFAKEDPIWTEMQHRQCMLELARSEEIGATHLAIIDADEMLTGNLMCRPDEIGICSHGCIKGKLEAMSPGSILQLPGYNLRNGINQYHDNGVWGNRWFSTAFADAPDLGWSGDKFHSREPGPRKLTANRPIQQGQGGILHLWGASERRLIAKHALYKVTEHIRKMNTVEHIELTYNDWRSPEDNMKHWPSQTEWGKPWIFAAIPESWWAPYAHLMKYLDVDAEPWQEAEARRLLAQHGRETFAGLDLFGVA